MVNFSLEGKVALVTGASYGIGFAIASAFAEQGAKICFNDINQELVDKGIAAYKAEGIEAKGYVCDVTNEEQVNAMVAQIEKEVGVIDILVNNAGIIKRIPMHEMSAAEFRQVIDVDLNAPFIVSKAVIPSMIKKGHGKIINICSMMSELGRETVSAYAAAKGGLKMLTRNIASEYGEFNIQCNGNITVGTHTFHKTFTREYKIIEINRNQVRFRYFYHICKTGNKTAHRETTVCTYTHHLTDIFHPFRLGKCLFYGIQRRSNTCCCIIHFMRNHTNHFLIRLFLGLHHFIRQAFYQKKRMLESPVDE